MSFLEEWFGEKSQQVLADLVREVVDVSGVVVEIGAWEGRSTVAMATAAWPRIVHTVDTWEGSPGEISADLAATRDVFSTWRANVAELTKGNVIAHQCGWRDYVPTVTGPVALAFIDAEHSYVEVRDTIAALRPLMASGGVLCGDDHHHPPVRQAVLEAFGDDAQVHASLWIWRAP